MDGDFSAKVMRFSYDAAGSVVAVDYSTDGGSTFTTYYYLRNAQNDVIKLIDGSGNTVVEYTYDSWGKIISSTGTLANTVGTDQPFRYRGYVYDEETEWYYLQSRYYDPSTCRFISADVYLSTGQGVIGHNAFAYCNNNPLNYVDYAGSACSAVATQHGINMYEGGGIWVTIPSEAVSFLIIDLVCVALAVIGEGLETAAKSISCSISAAFESTVNGPYTVYGLFDGDECVYVGRTKDVSARRNAHKNDPKRKDYVFQELFTNLNYEEARGLEQSLMLLLHTKNTANKAMNQINGISPQNGNLFTYIAAGNSVLTSSLEYVSNLIDNEILSWLGV